MKVSIITVTYNSAETIEQTIQSVMSQDYPNIEYLIVDGGSNDTTLEIVNTYANKISKIISEKDEGLYDALNKGIAMASGDIIGFIHSDDFYTDAGVIQRYVDAFVKTGCDAVYSDLYYVDKNNTDKIIRTWKSGTYTKSSFLFGWMPPHPTFFVKKEIYQKYGVFNTTFKSAADYELMLRLIFKNKIKLAYLPYFTVKMRVGGKSNLSLKNRLFANHEDRKAWQINGLKPYFFTLYLKPLRKLSQFFKR